jgi:extracellular factor (EF) 3-hydroxypalmitic acid methyl ester biosynthesis protein
MENHIANSELKNSLVVCRNSQGLEVRGTPVKLTRFAAAFEIYSPDSDLRLSEVLNEFKIVLQGKTIYSGRATVSNLVNHGPVLVCETSLDEAALADAALNSSLAKNGPWQESFDGFIREWQKVYQVLPEYKLVVADMQMFLTDLRLWFEQFEFSLHDVPARERDAVERRLINSLDKSIWTSLNHLFEKFELVSQKVPRDHEPVHHLYAKRQLHPLLMCSPFMYRIYRKPLGYAGDYEMVRMILRDSHEGNSLFAKALNRWLLAQVPAEAHRQRVQLLTQRLVSEGLRTRLGKKRLRVFNLGCGPAQEVIQFIKEHDLSDQADFTLLDFNEETINQTKAAVTEAKVRHHRTTTFQMVKKSVIQMAKTPGRVTKDKYDLVYCAGLFDYLQDDISKQLMNVMYGLVAPGGLLIATNVGANNPIQKIMDLIFEWRLIYRNSRDMAALSPDEADPDDCKITAEATGCNIFIEVRKPAAAR